MEQTSPSYSINTEASINNFINDLDSIDNDPEKKINNISNVLAFSDKIFENPAMLKKIKWSQIKLIDVRFKQLSMSLKNDKNLKKDKELNEKIKKAENKIENELESTELLINKSLENVKKNKICLKKFIFDLCNGKITHPMSIQEAIEFIKNADEDFKSIILHNSDLFSLYEYKRGVLIDAPPKEIRDCILEQIGKHKIAISQEYSVSIAIDRLRLQRLFVLNNLEEVYNKSIEMLESVQHKCFPPTIAWYVGSNKDDNEAYFEYKMQEISHKYDIKLITDHPDANNHFQNTGNTLVFSDKLLGPFPQDFVDFSQNEVRIPLILDSNYPSWIDMQSKLKAAREKRDSDWRKINPEMKRAPSQFLPRLGTLLRDELQKKAIGLALAIEATPIMNLTHSEGGNTLLGKRGDSMFAIVGKDSYELSKLILERDLGRAVNEEEVKIAFAIDFGIKKEMVYFVEQPGDFHLDMNLAIIGPNTVVVNDAIIAQKIFETDNNELLGNDKDKIEEAKKKNLPYFLVKNQFEDKTAKDLEKHGFNVIRFPGVFYSLAPYSRVPLMNFFNMVTAETPSHTKLVVAMGVMNEKYKKLFFDMIGQGDYFRDVQEEAIYFLDMESTKQTLLRHGGISCRTKTI